MVDAVNQHTFNINTLRFVLSGAIIGIAVMGVVYQFPYHDAVGGVLGGALVLFAKAKHFF